MDQNKFQIGREIIEKRCKDNDACIAQYTRLINMTTEEDFLQVLVDNIGWVASKKGILDI